MFSLTNRFDDIFVYGEHTIHVYLSFDNVLRLFELFSDNDFNEYEKIDVALSMLTRDIMAGLSKLDILEKEKLLMYIMKEFLNIDFEDVKTSDTKLFDLKQDGGIIYSSFLFDYNMDLFEQQGKLHWFKFIELLTHLSDDSKFKKVLEIRQMPVPKADKHNAEHRRNVLNAKRVYSLENKATEEEQVAEIDRKFDDLALMLGG